VNLIFGKFSGLAQVDIDGRTGRVAVEGVIDTAIDPIRNPVTGAPHQIRTILPTGFEFTESEVVSGKSKVTGSIPMTLDGSHAHLAHIHWSTRGVVR